MPENENKTNVGSVGKSVVVSGDGNTIINVRIENISELIEILSEANLSHDSTEKPRKADILEIVNIIKKIGASEEFKKVLSDIPSQSDNTRQYADFVHKLPEHHLKIKIRTDESAQPLPIHLLVRLISVPCHRSGKKNKLFTLRIYLWKSQNDIRTIYPTTSCDGEAPEEALPLSDIRKKLDECIYLISRDNKIEYVEFILPCELIALEVDQWVMKQGAPLGIKLGEEYPVYIRFDRKNFRGSFCDEWERLWKHFNNHTQSHNSSVFWLCDHQEYNPNNLCRCFSKSCLMITFMPKSDGRIGLGHVIGQAGIPVALCYRKDKSNSSVENDMRAIIKDKCLSELRMLIYDKRREVPSDDESHIGNHLTLIWDDPDRVLPKEHSRNPLEYARKRIT